MPLGSDEKSKTDRAFRIYNLMQRDPNKRRGNARIKLTDAMRYAGFKGEVAKSGRCEYQRVFRLVQNQKKVRDREEAAAESTVPRPPNVLVPNTSSQNPPVSPMTIDGQTRGSNQSAVDSNDRSSTTTTTSSTNTSTSMIREGTVIPDDFDNNYYVWPLTYPDGLHTINS